MQLLDRTSRLNLDTRGINPTTVHQLFEYQVLVIQLSSGRLLFLELIVNVPSSLWDRRSGRPPPECVGIWWAGKETINFLTNRSFNFSLILNVIFSFFCLHNWWQLSPRHCVSRTGLFTYALRAIWRCKAVILVHRLMRPGRTVCGCEERVVRFSPYTI